MAMSAGADLQQLLEEADALEELASEVQADDAAVGTAALRSLERRYQAWHANAVLFLDDEQRKRFEFEYEGNWAQFRIKHFLQNGRKPRVRLANMPEELESQLSPWQHSFNDAFRGPLLAQKKILMNAAAVSAQPQGLAVSLDFLEGVFRNFPHTVAILQREHKSGRIKISDEYDVQRLMQAFLHLHYADVRREEHSPSRGGSNTRMDFLLPQAKLAVEAKMTRPSLSRAKVGDEIYADIRRYEKHPDAEGLFAFIYDPGRLLENPSGFEFDFRSDDRAAFPTRVVIAH